MLEQTYKTMMKIGLAKSRDEQTVQMIDEAMGNKGNRWHTERFPVSAMQMAILDRLYDIGKDCTLNAKQMLSEGTRLAYVVDKDWGLHRIHDRKQTSCGHDEVEYEIYKLYDFDPKTGECTTVYEGKQGEKYADLTELSKAAGKLRDAHVALGGSERWEHSYYNDSTYKGQCAWDNKRHPKTNLPCKHHREPVSETVIGQYKQRETGHIRQSLYTGSYYHRRIILNADSYDLVIWDEQDHAEILKGVDDSEVLDAIKHAIRQMKTESRPWLQSNYEKYNSETKQYEYKGKRGHYRLGLWWSIERQQKQAIDTAENIALDGTKLNGWTYTTTTYSKNRTEGRWQGTVPVYGISPNAKPKDAIAVGWAAEIMLWEKKHQAEDVCKLLNTGRLSRDYMNGEPKEQCSVVEIEKTVELQHTHIDLVKQYQPHEYYFMCHEGDIPAEQNYICYHETSIEGVAQ